MRSVWILLLLATLVFSTTVVTRADPASIDVALPKLREHFPDIRIIPADPLQWKALIDRGGVDFLWAGAPVLYESLYRDGYLAPMPPLPEVPDRVGNIPLKRYGPDGEVYYVVYALLGYVIGYSAESLVGLKPVCSWRDMASLELTQYYLTTGRKPLAIAKPSKSTSTAAMMQLVTEIYGWEEGWRYLTAMAALARFVDSSGAVRDMVKRGEALFGPMVDYFAFVAGLDYCIPQDGTDILYDPVAIPKSADRSKAEALAKFFLTEIAKYTVDRYILPGNPALLDSPDVNQTKASLLKKHLEKLMNSKILAVPPEKSASYYYSFVYYYEATLVDLQDLLTEVWAKLAKARLDGRITEAQFNQLWAALAAPVNYTDPATGSVQTFTYQNAVEINDKLAKDPTYRDQIYHAWREAARSKYRQVAAQLEAAQRAEPRASTELGWTPILYALSFALIFALSYIVLRSRMRKSHESAAGGSLSV